MGNIYRFLRLTVGVVVNSIDPQTAERRAAYHADITYGTNNEFGFDYLRDNMVNSLDQMVQRELNFAIVDEVDNILIDEARTPLIISGQGQESTEQLCSICPLGTALESRAGLYRRRETRPCSSTSPGSRKSSNWLVLKTSTPRKILT